MSAPLIKNAKKLKRTPLLVKVGSPFEIIQKTGRMDAATRNELNTEIMLRLAALLPEDKRGFYADKQKEFTLTSDIPLALK